MFMHARRFGRAFASFWRSGFGAKLFTTVSLLLMIGLIDAGPRYFRAFETEYLSMRTVVNPVVLSPAMPQYSLVSYRDNFTHQLELCVTRVRDSLTEMGLQKSNNAPAGFKMLALRPDLQISDAERPLDSAQILIFLDARLECGCEQSGNFHLVRFVINPNDLRVTVLRDEVVSWYAYLSKNMPNTGGM
jgi:hypothetical protein